jgi:hypothetical protein
VQEFTLLSTVRVTSLSILLACTFPALAQDKPSETIVVRGTRIDPQQARQQAVDFVKKTGVAHGQQQVARWVVPICIKVVGLTTPQAARIEKLMVDIAFEANVAVAKPGCQPNITVSFAPDAGEVVRYIYARKPRQLDELSRAEKEQLLNGSAPVRWWYATQMLDRDGVKANNISAPWITAGEGANPTYLSLPGDGVTATQQYNSGSIVRTPTVRSLYGATVVVDARKVSSAPLDAIAAYAAMVAFAEMNASDPPPDSILGMFKPESIETSLTDWDMAFLTSLYRMPLDRRSRIQRGHLVEALLDERLPKKGAAKKP